MHDDSGAAGRHDDEMETPSRSPERAGLVLTALIVVAGVANLNLSVANVALPDIGKHFDSGQTTLDLIAVGYSLGLACSVLWLGALGDRYGRKLMLILGTALAIPMSLLAAYAPSDTVLFVARLGGGIAAGMAYPTTLALIAALWAGPGRTKSIALWSALGGAIASLGPLLSGFLLEHFYWGSVFLVTLPLAVVAIVLAWWLVPAHVNESTEPVDNLGGVLSLVLVGALILSINFAPVPDKGTLSIVLALIAAAALGAFFVRQRRAKNPLYDLEVAARPTFWVAACAGIIVFGSLMGAAFVSQQYLQNVLGYSTLQAGAAFLPAVVFMVLVAPRSAKLVEARGARFTLLFGYVFLLVAFLAMLLLWKEHSSYWEIAIAYALIGIGVGLGGHTGIALADELGSGSACGDGLGHRRPAARPRRGGHAVDLRRAPHRRLRRRGGIADREFREERLREHAGGADEVVRERSRHGVQVSHVDPERDRRGSEDGLPSGRPVGLHRRRDRDSRRRRPRLLLLPEEGRGGGTARAVPQYGRGLTRRFRAWARWRPEEAPSRRAGPRAGSTER